MIQRPRKPLFKLGRTVVTPAARDAIAETRDTCLWFLDRHIQGDWSELCEEDREADFAAVLNGGRIFSSYKLRDGTPIWVITEADRSVTTILLPDDY